MLEHHPLFKDFPDMHSQIHELKENDMHFRNQFNLYHDIDKQIYRIESNEDFVSDDELKQLKIKRTHLKDILHKDLNACKSA